MVVSVDEAKRDKLPYQNILLFALFLYWIWVPLGSAPIYIWGIKLDIVSSIISSLLMLFVAVLLLKGSAIVFLRPRSRILLAVLFFYWFSLFISVLLSVNFEHSLSRFIVISGYLLSAVLIGFLYPRNLRVATYYAFTFGVIGALIIIAAWQILGMSSWGRMTIPTWTGGSFRYFPSGWGSSADPNILGAGLGIMLVFGLLSGFKNQVKIVGAALIFMAVLLTMSRTAFISIVLGFFLSAIFLFSVRNLKVSLNFGLGIKSVLFLVVLAILVGIFSGAGQQLVGRISNITEKRSLETSRLQIMTDVLAGWPETWKTFLFGHGFNMTIITQDPHNIYITVLYDSGVLGFLGLLFLLIYLLQILADIRHKQLKFFYLWLFFYIILSGLTYWHTKTFWVPLSMMILIWNADYLENRRCNTASKQYSSFKKRFGR